MNETRLAKDAYVKTAVPVGIVAGLLSGLPFINMLNCCCFYYLGGGFLAVFLLSRRSDIMTLVDGLLCGVITGFATGVVASLLNGISLMLGFNQGLYAVKTMMKLYEKIELPPEAAVKINEQLAEQMENLQNMTVADVLKNSLIAIVSAIVVCAIGGLIAALIFKKEANPQAENEQSGS